ncbi:MAG: hypothetical protein V4639_00270 [Pseudomonadota bacterium]|nr:hypothetical protein [Polaromonas sp.]
MREPIEKLVMSWGDNDLQRIKLRIAHLERWLFKSYEPNKFGDGDFWLRLERWLGNVSSDEDKQLLFRLVVELLYMGPVEFEELYRCAYQGPIAKWLIDKEGIDVFDLDAQERLRDAAKETWFCPVTDSFRINSFFHVNNLPAGANLRPDWHSILRLGDTYKLNKYCAKMGIKRLVLLEDFVGGGDQSLAAVRYAATHVRDLEVLFVPLVICPDGAEAARKLESELCARRPGCLRYEAVMEMPDDAFLTIAQSFLVEPNSYITRLRALINATYVAVSGGAPLGQKPYDPFGYPSHKPTGGLVVMYSNTPDNTLPLVHWRPTTKSWSPVFPRHSRV